MQLIKNKKIQKYYIEFPDIIFSILLLIIVAVIAYNQYGFPFKIKYEITDGSTHFFFAQQFYEDATLLYNRDASDMYNSRFRLPGAYVNEGILFMIFDGIILFTDLFILFDLVLLYLSGVLMYFLLKAYSKSSKKTYILSAIFSIMYMLGYPLNSMLSGYVYLSLALATIIAFLLLLSNYEKEEIKDTIALPILSLISFEMFFSYAYFIPIIYLAIIINVIIKSKKKNEKVFSEDNIMIIGYLILVPLIIGATYFLIMPLVKGLRTEVSTIGTPGKIYENYITNYLCLIPIFIIGIIEKIKNKRKNNNVNTILFILSIIFAIILFVGNKLDIVSEYYFYKAYYIIWPLSIYNAYIIIADILEEKCEKIKRATYVYICIYAILVIIGTWILKVNIGINNIFYSNQQVLENDFCMLEHGEVELAKIAKQKIDFNQTYIFTSGLFSGRMLWISVLYDDNQQIYFDYATKYHRTIEKWIKERNEKYYVAYYKDYELAEISKVNPEENSEKYKILYSNEYGFILERIEM